jgi:hypothetical protein
VGFHSRNFCRSFSPRRNRTKYGYDANGRGEKHRLRFELHEPPVRRHALRPITILIPSLAEMEQALIDAAFEYTRQRGLTPGEDSLVLLDPAGNWIELTASPEVR